MLQETYLLSTISTHPCKYLHSLHRLVTVWHYDWRSAGLSWRLIKGLVSEDGGWWLAVGGSSAALWPEPPLASGPVRRGTAWRPLHLLTWPRAPPAPALGTRPSTAPMDTQDTPTSQHTESGGQTVILHKPLSRPPWLIFAVSKHCLVLCTCTITAPIYHENAKCLFLTRYFHFHTKYWCIVLQEILKIEPPIMLLQYHWSWEHVMHLLQCIGIGSVRVALDQSLERGPVQILTRAANEPSAKFS